MKRLLSLDVLRAVAVLLVLLAHTRAFVPWTPSMDLLAQGGAVGVDLFFVLSGFLVSGLLFTEQEKTGTINCSRFLVRRGFKLYPAFWCFMAVTAAVSGASSGLVNELLFIQNYQPGLWGHTWSLGVEEHFYIALPFLLVFVPWRYIPWLTAGSLVLCAELRCFAVTGDTELWRAVRCPTHLRFDALFVGVWLRYAFQDERFVGYCARFAPLLGVAGSLLICPAFVCQTFVSPLYLTAGLALSSIGSACWVAGAVSRGFRENTVTRSLGYIGRHSYSIYLWHECLIFWVVRPLGLSGAPAIVLYATGSLVLGIVAAKVVEIPMLSLRDRLFAPRQQRGTNAIGSVTAAA